MPQGKKQGRGRSKMRGKGKGKIKGKTKEAGEDTKKLLKSYERNCILTNSKMCPGIRKLLKSAAEEDKVVTKFILESVPGVNEGDQPVLFDPLIISLRQERYRQLQDFHVWTYPLTFEDVASLAEFLEKSVNPIRMLELLDCLIEAPTVSRLVQPLHTCDSLTTLVLDYNEFGDEGCKNLCTGLEGNKIMLSLSLCYCNLQVQSGKYLGHTVSTTAIRELSLDGNELQCDGVIELITLCVDQAEIEAYQREVEAHEKALKIEEGMTPESKKKKKKKKPYTPPPVGPWIHKLHLADNGIDGFSDSGILAPIICMRLFKKLLMNSKCLEELDLEDNSMGELGGREILEGLKYRKEAKLGACKVYTTYKITTDTFSSIVKLGNRLKKRRKRKGKKGKSRKI